MPQSHVSAEAPVAVDVSPPRRSSIEKPPLLSESDFEDDDEDDEDTAFDRLPEEIIQQ